MGLKIKNLQLAVRRAVLKKLNVRTLSDDPLACFRDCCPECCPACPTCDPETVWTTTVSGVTPVPPNDCSGWNGDWTFLSTHENPAPGLVADWYAEPDYSGGSRQFECFSEGTGGPVYAFMTCTDGITTILFFADSVLFATYELTETLLCDDCNTFNLVSTPTDPCCEGWPSTLTVCGTTFVCLCYGWVGAETQNGCRTYPGSTSDDWVLESTYDSGTDTTTFTLYKNEVLVEVIGTNTGFLDVVFPITVNDGACKYFCIGSGCYELNEEYAGPFDSGPYDTMELCEDVCGCGTADWGCATGGMWEIISDNCTGSGTPAYPIEPCTEENVTDETQTPCDCGMGLRIQASPEETTKVSPEEAKPLKLRTTTKPKPCGCNKKRSIKK